MKVYKQIIIKTATMLTAIVALFWLSSQVAVSQGNMGGSNVSGIITSETGEPLIGVNVREKGSTNGGITDLDGKYSFQVSNRNVVLVFSYIGFVTQEINLQGRNSLNVTLVEDTQTLDEVIVVGYGTLKKSDLTGAVARVALEDKAPVPNINLAQVLSGASAGVNITQTGLAGGDARLSIRGKTSLSANDNPLIVLDGIIYNGSLNDLNVNDIEYVDILKDASAAAVYGSRSANGVILISTKKGKSGKPKVNVNAFYGTQGYTPSEMKVMNAEQYAIRLVDYYYQQDLYKWYATKPTANAGKPAYPDINDRNFVASRLRRAEEQAMYLDTSTKHDIDWVDVVSRESPIIQGYDVNYSGSTDKTNYYASLSYNSEEGVMENDQFSRVTLNTKLDTKFTSWLSAGLNINYAWRDYSGRHATLNDAREASPLANVDPYDLQNAPLYITDENYMVYPLSPLRVSDRDVRTTLFYVGNLRLDVPFVKGLSYDFNYSNTSVNEDRRTFWPRNTDEGSATRGRAERQPRVRTDWIFNNIISYINKFGDHSVNATLLYSREKSAYTRFTMRSEYFDNDALGYDNLAMGTTITARDNESWEEMGVSYMGRVNYQFKNRYMAAATVRRDGFSGFGSTNKFVTLPSFSLGWIISEEDFIKDKAPALYTKLRLSYGQNGNQGIGRYSSLSRMGTDPYVYGSSTVVGVYPNAMGNSGLRWEKTVSYNLGLDLGFLDRRINASIDLYTAQTTDVLVKRRLPWAAGYQEIWDNLGGIANKGVDIEITSQNVKTRDLQWDLGVEFSLNRDEITKLYGGDDDKDIGNGWFVGQPISSVYDYKIIGMWQEEDLYSGNIYDGWYPGQWKYEDLNGDNKITADDRQILGSKSPNFTLSISNTLRYKNWSLYFLLNTIAGGSDRYLINTYDYVNVSQRSDDVYRINQTSARHYWTPDNRTSESSGIYNSPAVYGGVWKNRGFTRLQDLSLTYSFSPKVLKALGGMEYLQIYLSGKNLLTFSDFPGWDPEYASLNTDDYAHQRGIRNIVCGVKLSF
ncbi:MAG: TonB-dependent receptor [Tannerellaceae bacterium]|jgi:TonB-linked SusC/RagA family outer membrane protein|nr:TonB-dependent receptor [Tannerellaceae bacterium]